MLINSTVENVELLFQIFLQNLYFYCKKYIKKKDLVKVMWIFTILAD